MEFGVEMAGIAEFDKLLSGITDRVATVETEVFPLVVADFREMGRKRWANEGPGWAPLRPATIEIETNLGYPYPSRLMYGRTGDLMNSLTEQTSDSVVRVEGDSLFMGTSVPYAQYHQAGPRQIKVFGRGKATLPERKVVDVKVEDAERWCALIRAAVMKGV